LQNAEKTNTVLSQEQYEHNVRLLAQVYVHSFTHSFILSFIIHTYINTYIYT